MRVFAKVTGVSDFLDVAGRLSRRWNTWPDAKHEWVCWFRGEPSIKSLSALQPRLFRKKQASVSDALHYEQELRIEFKRCAVQLIPGFKPANKWDWYFTMQHYGVPTRLLDWTDSALVGLFFALEMRQGSSDQQFTEDAVVYALDPWWLNHLTYRRLKSDLEGVALPEWDVSKKYLSDDELNSEKLDRKIPLAIDPTHLFGRVAAQKSRFVIFGKEKDRLWSLAENKTSRIVKIRIPSKNILQMKADLRLAGLTRSSIFPDLEGLGRELADWFDQQ